MSCSDYALDNTGSSENFRARTLEPDARYVCSWPKAALIRPDRIGSAYWGEAAAPLWPFS